VSEPTGHLQCPFCNDYGVDRLFVASLNMDACVCPSCGARWDERRDTGTFEGRGTRSSVISRPPR